MELLEKFHNYVKDSNNQEYDGFKLIYDQFISKEKLLSENNTYSDSNVNKLESMECQDGQVIEKYSSILADCEKPKLEDSHLNDLSKTTKRKKNQSWASMCESTSSSERSIESNQNLKSSNDSSLSSLTEAESTMKENIMPTNSWLSMNSSSNSGTSSLDNEDLYESQESDNKNRLDSLKKEGVNSNDCNNPIGSLFEESKPDYATPDSSLHKSNANNSKLIPQIKSSKYNIFTGETVNNSHLYKDEVSVFLKRKSNREIYE